MSVSRHHSRLRTRGMQWRVIAGAIAAAALAAGVAGCATMSTTSTTPPAAPSATTTATPPATTPTTTTTSLTGPVGTPYSDTDGSGNVMAVALTQIIDPAQGANQVATPNNGFRFVGAKFTITGKSGTFNDDANNDAVVVGSDNQSYTADFDDIAGCTNFKDGDFTVTPGTSTTGCVVFQVPQNVQVASVQWGR